MTEIHPTAVVSPDAVLGDDVTIQAYSIIGPHVTIGAHTAVGPHAVIDGWTVIGTHNEIYPFATIGYPPQDIRYRGEETRLHIGDHNVIREHVTIHRGSKDGRGVTQVGNNNFLMAYAHVAHDCQLGDYVIMANAATLGGHVQIEDHAVIGGLVAIHQFIRIGTYAFIGGKSGLRMDMPPYMLAFGAPAKLYGPNIVGLRRHNFSPEAIHALKKAYKILFRSGLTLKDAIEKASLEVERLPEVERLLQFLLNSSRRGFTR